MRLAESAEKEIIISVLMRTQALLLIALQTFRFTVV